MDWSTISVIINAVLSVIGVVLARYWLITKTKVEDLKAFVDVVNAALQDDAISPEELSAINDALRKLISRV